MTTTLDPWERTQAGDGTPPRIPARRHVDLYADADAMRAGAILDRSVPPGPTENREAVEGFGAFLARYRSAAFTPEEESMIAAARARAPRPAWMPRHPAPPVLR